MSEPILASPDPYPGLPARPTWLRPWAALHSREMSCSLDTMRRIALVMSEPARDLMRRYPRDSVLRCDCGERLCRGFLIVCGYADMGDEALLLVRTGPREDPHLRRDAALTVLFRGGNLTPEQVDVLACAPLGVC